MKRVLALTLLSGLTLALGFMTMPTVHAADREHQQMMADIRMLQEQTLRLHLLLSALDDFIRTVSMKLDEQADVNRKAFADQQLLVNNVADGVRILREKMDETNVRIASLSQEIEALRVAIPPPSVMTALPVDPVTGLPATPPEGTPAPTAAAPSPGVSPGVSPQRMFDTAWADYAAGQNALAIQGFESYIKTFPRSEQADDAQFYIGQAYKADGRLGEALAAFEQVLLTYPSGDKVPEASYQRGVTLEGLGELDRARQAYELVLRNYPNSVMAPLAKQALDRLSQPPR